MVHSISAFYKPLTEGDRDKISAVIASGYKVYRKIAAAAMVYQLVYMGLYDSRNLLKRPVSAFLKLLAADILLAGLIILIVKPLAGPVESISRVILSFIRL